MKKSFFKVFSLAMLLSIMLVQGVSADVFFPYPVQYEVEGEWHPLHPYNNSFEYGNASSSIADENRDASIILHYPLPKGQLGNASFHIMWNQTVMLDYNCTITPDKFDYDNDELVIMVMDGFLTVGYSEIIMHYCLLGNCMQFYCPDFSPWYMMSHNNNYAAWLHFARELTFHGNFSFDDPDDNCNAAMVGYTKCTGPDYSYTTECINVSGYYYFNSTLNHCKYGCMNGTCITIKTNCTNYCNYGELSCEGNNVVRCQKNVDNDCYSFSNMNITFCKDGCYEGQCLENVSVCTINSVICNNNNIYECELVNGAYKWVYRETCRYACNTTETNVTCIQIGDAHQVQNALNKLQSIMDFGFGGSIIIPYVIISVIISVFVGIKTTYMFSVWTMIGMVVLGVFINIIPLFIGFIIVVPTLFLVFRRRYD